MVILPVDSAERLLYIKTKYEQHQRALKLDPDWSTIKLTTTTARNKGRNLMEIAEKAVYSKKKLESDGEEI